MSVRSSFCKKDQDELALFLAAHPHSARDGKSLYQEFAKTHKTHSWQSWRAHYLSNRLTMEAVIRRKLRKSNQQQTEPMQNGNTDHRSRSPAQEVERVGRQPGRGSKGKGKAQPVDVIETYCDSDTPRGSRISRTGHQPQQFVLRRISSSRLSESRRSSDSINWSSSNQERPIYSDPSAPVITLSPEEEQAFFRFISRHPEGDLRLSLKLYETYHLQAPKFSPREYRAYYLSQGHKLQSAPPLRSITREHTRPCDSSINPSSIIHNSEASSGIPEVAGHLPVSKNPQAQTQTESSKLPLLEIDTLSVSTGSEDEPGLDFILSSSDHSDLISTLKTSRELLQSFLELQGDVFGPSDRRTGALALASPRVPEPQTSDRISHDRTPPVDAHSKLDNAPAPVILARELANGDGPSSESSSHTDARNLATAENLCSAKTSRTTSSFKPAQPPSTTQEAVALMGVFLTDFGDLYTPSEAVNLFHQCGDWTLMFEVATLKKLEKLKKKTQDGQIVNAMSGQDDEEEVDQGYVLEVQSRMWTHEEDAIILDIVSIDTSNLSDRKATLAQLLRDKSSDRASKLGKLIAKRGIQAIKNRMAFLLPMHEPNV